MAWPRFLQPEVLPCASIEIIRAPVDVTPDPADNRCVCGVRIANHFEAGHGTRLDCDDARRRYGVA